MPKKYIHQCYKDCHRAIEIIDCVPDKCRILMICGCKGRNTDGICERCFYEDKREEDGRTSSQ